MSSCHKVYLSKLLFKLSLKLFPLLKETLSDKASKSTEEASAIFLLEIDIGYSSAFHIASKFCGPTPGAIALLSQFVIPEEQGRSCSSAPSNAESEILLRPYAADIK